MRCLLFKPLNPLAFWPDSKLKVLCNLSLIMKILVSFIVISEFVSIPFASDQFCEIENEASACALEKSQSLSLQAWFHAMKDNFKSYQKEWTTLVEEKGRTVSPPTTKHLNVVPKRKELKLQWNQEIKKFKASKVGRVILRQDVEEEIQGYTFKMAQLSEISVLFNPKLLLP